MKAKIVAVLGLFLLAGVSIVDSPGIVGNIGLAATVLGIIFLFLGSRKMKLQ